MKQGKALQLFESLRIVSLSCTPFTKLDRFAFAGRERPCHTGFLAGLLSVSGCADLSVITVVSFVHSYVHSFSPSPVETASSNGKFGLQK